MPTPSDDSNVQSAPVDDTQEARSRLASCPPDDERPNIVTRQQQTERVDSPLPQPQSLPQADAAESLTSTERQAAQEPDVEAGASNSVAIPVERSKAEHIEDAGIPSGSIIGASPDATSDNDSRLAESMSAAAISSPAPSPQYLHFPDANKDRTRSSNSTTSFLRPGSKFRGTQQSDRQVYDVQVEIKDVDLTESFLCGYLRIQGLTDDHPTLTTFFEGEIIGPKYLFKTGHPSWNSSEKIDLQHWARFPAWRPLAKSTKSPNFTLKNYQQREHLFMRWKEYFLVPDHRVKTITGASFEGFYYICFNQCSGSVSGIYFHAKSEKYQQLELKHVDDRGCLPAVEFR